MNEYEVTVYEQDKINRDVCQWWTPDVLNGGGEWGVEDKLHLRKGLGNKLTQC